MESSFTFAADALAAGQAALERRAWLEALEAFRTVLDAGESPEALEGLATAAWWQDDPQTAFEAHERAFHLYREREDRRGAARRA